MIHSVYDFRQISFFNQSLSEDLITLYPLFLHRLNVVERRIKLYNLYCPHAEKKNMNHIGEKDRGM